MEAHAHAEVAAEGFRAHAKPLAAQMLRASCRHRFVKCAFGVPQGHAGRASAHPKASQEVGEGSQKLDSRGRPCRATFVLLACLATGDPSRGRRSSARARGGVCVERFASCVGNRR